MTDSNRNKKLIEKQIQQVAGNGILDRRSFLKSGSTLAVATFVSYSLDAKAVSKTADSEFDPARPPWMLKPGEPFSRYGVPSKYENEVIRWVAANADAKDNVADHSP